MLGGIGDYDGVTCDLIIGPLLFFLLHLKAACYFFILVEGIIPHCVVRRGTVV